MLIALGAAVVVVVAGVIAFLLLAKHGSTATANGASRTQAGGASQATAEASGSPLSSSPSVAGTTSADPMPQAINVPAPPPADAGGQLALVASGSDCTYPDGFDDAHNPVTYGPEQAVDGDLTTAWRCAGAGGHTLQLTPQSGTGQPVEVLDLGLVPGYAKTDPTTGANRFLENHTVTAVVWTLCDASNACYRIEQTILDPSPQMAWIHLSRPIVTTRASVTVTGTGNPNPRKDTTPISSVALWGYPLVDGG